LNCKRLLTFFWIITLLVLGITGCGGEIQIAEYPGNWPQRISSNEECHDISGTYKMTKDQSLLPFFLFGIVNYDSQEWKNLVRAYEKNILIDSDKITVTIESSDTDHLKIVLATNGVPVATQILSRSYQSHNKAVFFGQDKQSFRCEAEGIVINSAYIHDWNVYRLPKEEKKRRYRRLYGAVGPLGVSAGYFSFSKTINGNLVMHAHLYGCYPCENLDEYWQQWEHIPSTRGKSISN